MLAFWKQLVVTESQESGKGHVIQLSNFILSQTLPAGPEQRVWFPHTLTNQS